MYKEKLGIPDDHEFVRTSSKNESRKGWDTDIYGYDEKDSSGNFVASYVVRDGMCIYPPQNTVVSFEKFDANGNEINSGRI
jgi:hypothetical protein